VQDGAQTRPVKIKSFKSLPVARPSRLALNAEIFNCIAVVITSRGSEYNRALTRLRWPLSIITSSLVCQPAGLAAGNAVAAARQVLHKNYLYYRQVSIRVSIQGLFSGHTESTFSRQNFQCNMKYQANTFCSASRPIPRPH